MGLLAISGWLVAAALAVGISWSAIGVVQESVGAGQPVATALPPPAETSGPAPSSTRPTATPTVGTLAVGMGQGGTVSAQCVKGRPHVVSAVPRQGFGVESDDSGGEVKFGSSDHRTEVTVTCSGLTATVHVEEKSIAAGGGVDNHGGGRGGSGRGGGKDG